MLKLILSYINLAILLGVIFKLVAPRFRAFVRDRHDAIKRNLELNRVRLREAKSRYDDFSSKLKVVTQESDALRLQIQKEAQESSARQISNAKTATGAMIADARQAAQSLLQDFKQELKAEAGARVVARSEEFLRQKLSADDRVRIRKEFSQSLEKMQ
jgi:F0F1-type ATP synthase membrane subunit b/b'